MGTSKNRFFCKIKFNFGEGAIKNTTFWGMMNIFFMVRAFYTAVHRVKKAAFMPVLAQLSYCGQQRISIDVVGNVAKPYLCPGPDNADRSHHQAAGHHRHHSKYMLNPAASRCSRLIALLFPLGERSVSAALG